MRNISAENQIALEARSLVARDFLWIVARDRDTGDPVEEGLWSDVGNVTASVVDPDTGADDERNWYGSGTLVSISDIPMVSTLSIQQVTITLSQLHERVQQIVRDYDCRQAKVEIYRGLFDPETRRMVAPAPCRFVGFIDKIEIKTPAENGEGSVVATCVSHTQEITRSNPDTRSDASQKLRNGSDNFYEDTSTAGEWEVFWGTEKGKVQE